MSEQNNPTVYKISEDGIFWRTIIGLLLLLGFLLTGWSIALFASGIFLGMSFVLKAWTSKFEVLLVAKKDMEEGGE